MTETTKLAIMQPYIFPYIGYFQMIKAVDKFVFYDDVNYIKQGWINRNRILNNNSDFLFVVPIEKISSFTLINETKIKQNLYQNWVQKFLKTIQLNYRKAPYFESVFELIQPILNQDKKTISELAILSITEISKFLNIKTEIIISSEKYKNSGLERQARLIDICKQEESTHYINALGGQELYQKEDFKKEGIRLDFIQPLPIEYSQFHHKFVPWLSIIDVLMFNSLEETNVMLSQFELI